MGDADTYDVSSDQVMESPQPATERYENESVRLVAKYHESTCASGQPI